MTDFFTDTRSSMDACSPLDEEIAAFLDGTLSPEDRERITAHLDSCESCYEVFAAAVQFQEDEAKEGSFPFDHDLAGTGVSPLKEGGVLPFPFAAEADRTGVSQSPVTKPEKVRPRAPQWLALAASLLLVPALGYLAWQEFTAPPRIVLADVIEPLEQETKISDLLYEDVTRGDPPPGDAFAMRPNFMAGVYLLDLRLSVQAEDVERTQSRLQGLAGSLKEIPLLPDALAETYEDEYLRMESPSDLARFAPELPAKEAEIQELLAENEAFQFGLWTEAGRLSALAEAPEFFESRQNSRFLSQLLKEDALPVPAELHESVLEHLQTLQRVWGEGNRSPNYQLIAERLGIIIQAIDRYEEDFSYEN